MSPKATRNKWRVNKKITLWWSDEKKSRQLETTFLSLDNTAWVIKLFYTNIDQRKAKHAFMHADVFIRRGRDSTRNAQHQTIDPGNRKVVGRPRAKTTRWHQRREQARTPEVSAVRTLTPSATSRQRGSGSRCTQHAHERHNGKPRRTTGEMIRAAPLCQRPTVR